MSSVIVSAVRLPTGKFLGALKGFTAPQLGALVVREAVARARIDPRDVDECLMGNVVSAGLGQNPARQAALGGGLDERVSALTVNQVCGSGLKAVMLAAQAIGAGDARIVVAGGMESMSNGPYLVRGAREGLRLGHRELVDAMIHDGLWCACENWHMGMSGEAVAEKYGISREAQDAYAARSHARASDAIRQGWFRDEILPVNVPQRKGPPVVFDRDEPVREDTSTGTLATLKPAFKEGGTVTAGNAPGVNDGAAALVVMHADEAARRGLTPLARIVAQATSGLAPRWVMMTPVDAVRQVLRKAGWQTGDVDLFELNEAFAVQAIAVMRELDLDPARVNVHGGAVALGHPIGASGARVLTTLLYAMQRRGARRGVATLCLGGGNGVALAVER
ncbi:MAG TPA: acetyl-CoA C-acetyltransferase [Vicinamibacterales bacterium]